MEAQKVSGDTRVDEDYECPSCGSNDLFSPTYKQRKCCGCGHRGSETEFRVSEDAECPDCGDMAPKTHNPDIHTCRGCYNQFNN